MSDESSNLRDINKATENFEKLNELIVSLKGRMLVVPKSGRAELIKNLLLAQGDYVTKLTELTILKAKLGVVNKTWYKKGD